MIQKLYRAVCLFLLIGLAACSETEEAPLAGEAGEKRPNFLIILADDLGFSDIGAFGGEISTPNLDALATGGVRFSNFNVHVFCTPTRAMLLTGVNNHAAGIGTMAGEWRGDQKGQPGYETFLRSDVVTVARQLRDNGYFTTMAGKWDLGGRNDAALLPDKRGFEESFVLVEGSADHFRAFPALAELPDINYAENGAIVDVPEPFYSTNLYGSKIIEQLEGNRATGRPFFGYLSFTAPHYPLQAPAEAIAKYEGVYDAGYEPIRLARIERMKELGIIAPDTIAAVPSDEWPTWAELSPEMRAYEARRMQVYAAMIDEMDREIGRVLRYLEETGQRDDTVILFLSDNGAEGGNVLDWAPYYVEWAETTYDLSLGNLGHPNSFAWAGPQWAHVSAAPYRMFKAFTTRGGTQSPAILNFPGRVAAGDVIEDFAFVTDIPSTLLDWAGIASHKGRYAGVPVRPMEGRSLRPLVEGRQALDRADDVFVWEMIDRRAVQKGDWKMTWINAPWGAGVGTWSLYNLEEDPTELRDIAAEHPEIVAELVSEWEAYIEKNGVVLADYSNLTYTNLKSHFTWLPSPAERVNE